MPVSINPVQKKGEGDLGAILGAVKLAFDVYGAGKDRDARETYNQAMLKNQENESALRSKQMEDMAGSKTAELSLKERELALKDRQGREQTALEKDRLNFAKQTALDKNALKLPGADGKSVDPKTLNATEKSRYDNIVMASKGVADMRDALAKGQWTVHPFGDNDFTVGQRDFTEALGRLQSGGAISGDEEKRFAAMAPGVFDTAQMKQQKLNKLENEMNSRLKTLGIDPGAIQELADRKRGGPPSLGGGFGTAVAAPTAQAPQVGTIDGNHVYVGGDPADPKSWQEVRK